MKKMNFEEMIEKFIEDSFFNLNPDLTAITYSDIFTGLIWSILLSVIIANTYRGTHRGISYSQSFTQTLVLISAIVSTVMLIVGTDIARAFTLVGALSIVRFRNALKDTRDVGFIFFTMAIGMACGTRFYTLAIIVTVVLCGLSYFMYLTQFGQKGLAQDILEMNFPTNKDYAYVLSPILVKNLKYYSILSIDSINEKINRLTFVVTFKRKRKIFSSMKLIRRKDDTPEDFTTKSKLLTELQRNDDITNIKVISGSNVTEI